MAKISIKKAEKELVELKEALKPVDAKIKETGGPKSQWWLLGMKGRIRGLEKKIEDLKVGKIRTDEISPEDMELEKRIKNLEKTIKREE